MTYIKYYVILYINLILKSIKHAKFAAFVKYYEIKMLPQKSVQKSF